MSYETEQCVLGSIMLDKTCVPLMAEMLKPEMFQDVIHRMAFEGILRLHDEGAAIDAVTVKNLGVDVEQCREIMESVPSAASAEYYAKIVIEDYKVLSLKALSREIDAITLTDSKSDEMISLVQKSVTKHTEYDDMKVISHAGDVAKTLVFEPGGSNRIPTGFSGIDGLIVGLYKTDYMVIGGRPGIGKTAMMVDIATNMSWEQGIPTAFYSCEMSPEEITRRMASARCGVSLLDVETGRADPVDIERLYEAARQMKDCPIYIQKASGLTPSKLKRHIASDKRKFGIKVAFVDYIQIMKAENKGSRYERITDISEGLKQIPIELDVPIVAGSQLKRLEHASRPTLTSFRDSGAIEEHATIIIGLHRDSYYTPESPDDEADATILKGRAFGTGRVPLTFTGELTHFTDKRWMG